MSSAIDKLESHYDFIICGAGSSGSVVARRLAENPAVSVLLLEAGGDDAVPSVTEPLRWFENFGTERTWSFVAEPNPNLNQRRLQLPMGRVLGGGSSVNGMAWARGHKRDWDFFATETGDPAWSYEAVLSLYRRIEDWQGAADPRYRGTGGPMIVQPPADPNPIAPAMLDGARAAGIPTYQHNNGRMMEVADGGAALLDLCIRDGKRVSVYNSYVPREQSNLTVKNNALITKLILDNQKATGVEVSLGGKLQRVSAGVEVVLSLGAIHTPKLLMMSGIGELTELQRHGIRVSQSLPGVGRNFQDHVQVGCVWEYREPLPPRNNGGEATFFWRSDSRLPSPDLQCIAAEVPLTSPEIAVNYPLPESAWTLTAGLVRPQSQGRVRLTGPYPNDPVQIEANTFSHPDDFKAMLACVELCREIGNSSALQPYAKREVMPGNLKGAALEHFVRDAAVTSYHQTCTAKMGRDPMSVVDSQLRVHGIQNLRIADGSIMPRIVTGNTMAACIVIGERAGDILRTTHKL